MSDRDLWAWLINHVGEPVPCGVCGALAAGGDMTEAAVPRHIAEFQLRGEEGSLTFVVHAVERVCADCSLFAN